MRLSRRRLLGSAGALPLAATPCPTASGAYAHAARTIRIGVLTDLSSRFTGFAGAGSVLAARMAVEDFGPDTQGFDVALVSADHQNRADLGATTALAWFDRAGVDAIVDVPNSAVALAVTEIARERNRVLIVSSAATADLTGPHCTPNTVHWTYDTFSQTAGTARALVAAGGETWFFITADHGFGHALEAETERFVTLSGGRVIGRVRHPFPGTDFAAVLREAQASRAAVICLATAGEDLIRCVGQAGALGITRGGQTLAGLLAFTTDVHGLGLETAQGLTLTSAFYHDRTDACRAFSERFHPRNRGIRPSMAHAGVYAGVLHYLKSVAAAGVETAKRDGAAVVAAMKRLPTDDPLFGQGEIRQDGRKLHPMHLCAVKRPAESRAPWDYLRLVREIPTADAWRPLAEGACPMGRL